MIIFMWILLALSMCMFAWSGYSLYQNDDDSLAVSIMQALFAFSILMLDLIIYLLWLWLSK